jgi:hypothetical protein
MRKLLVALAFLPLAVASSPRAMAGFVFTGSGTGPAGGAVSASADFSISGPNLNIVLSNTTPGGTAARGDLLTGLIFDIADPGVALGSLSSTSLNGSSLLFTDKTTAPFGGAVSGSWTSVMASPPSGRYGVATSGLSGLFSAGEISLGGGGENYAIAAAGTFPAPPGSGTSGSFNASAFPLVQDALHFVLPITQGTLDGFDFTNVKFAFGSHGDTIPGTGSFGPASVPEAGSLMVWGVLIAGAAVIYRRRKAWRN